VIPLQAEIRIIVKRESKRAALRRLLSDRRWHTSTELERIGGRRYGARVQELRGGADGFPALEVACEALDAASGEFRWKAVGEFIPGANLDGGALEAARAVTP
jgi:hypothetical protein